ncbi:amidase family protein [Microbaculum marinum]|uniref:amidase family protein n=1 Tax=Microbaculum marinum TaxID=1764581 RepID=UPI0036101AC4
MPSHRSPDPLRRPLRGIAAAVREGSLDPDDLAERARAAAEAAAGLNAFTVVASGGAAQRTGPLAGVPFAAKDAIATRDLPTCAASPALAGWTVGEDAAAIRLLREAGATLIGKANMHELSFGVTSNNAAFGPVRNPYAGDRIAGGSSGGSAVAVAVGAAADTGGSARIPAAHCGLTGFRPSSGRWPDAGLIKVSPTRDTIGAIVRHADDGLLLDEILTGDGAMPSVPALRDLRIGLLRAGETDDVAADLAAIVNGFVDRLRSAGAAIVELDASALFELEAQCGFPIALHEARIELMALAGDLGIGFAEFAARIASPDVRAIVGGLAESGDPQLYDTAIAVTRPALQRAYEDLFKGVDVLVMPATPLTAARIGEDDTVTLNGRQVPTFPTYARLTSPASVAGVPSVSIPVGRTADGLPVGLLVEGRAGSDRALLAAAGALGAVAEPIPDP